MKWYDDEKHIGYDITGKKITKKEKQDKLDSFLATMDDSKNWSVFKTLSVYNELSSSVILMRFLGALGAKFTMTIMTRKLSLLKTRASSFVECSKEKLHMLTLIHMRYVSGLCLAVFQYTNHFNI